MDGFEHENVKPIVWKRRKSESNESKEIDVSNNCHDEGENRHRSDASLQLSTHKSTSSVVQKCAMPLLPIPKVDEWCSDSSIVLTGTACKGGTGPPVGAVDIGVSKSAYYFCIALPGVKKDPSEFSCEISSEGKVCVHGTTSTGEKTVVKYSRVFEMKFQQQCAPGPFKLFFSLPGPVDPRLFSPKFRTDGMFEGIVAKYEKASVSYSQ